MSFPRVSTPQDFLDGGTITSDDPLHIGARRATRQPSPPRTPARRHERPLLSSHRTARLIGEGTTGALLAMSNSSTKGGNGAGRTTLINNGVSGFQLTERLGGPRGETETLKVFITAMGVNEVFNDLPFAARLRRTCAIVLSIPRKSFPHRTSTALPRWQTPPSQHAPVPKPRQHRGNA